MTEVRTLTSHGSASYLGLPLYKRFLNQIFTKSYLVNDSAVKVLQPLFVVTVSVVSAIVIVPFPRLLDDLSGQNNKSCASALDLMPGPVYTFIFCPKHMIFSTFS
ncbi:hypothetical protein RRG08_017489 [Elysia crispata]|uniref:Uncharacterized protein n=1 Tax=Elysia crispata TaxID=231223 RepID=A0AAE0YHU8_9GAST|nr:hypothetical protein RRG08_017489 [Elysia crispata]